MMPTKMLAAAIKYTGRGLRVFPVVPSAKRPLTQHGVNAATTDVGTIRDWWDRWPDANIGLACGEKSGLIVLDYDCKSGKRGLETFKAIQERFNLDTLTAETPSGGLHQFFRYVPGLNNRVDSLPELPGLDIRTDGGYVVIAPSLVDGKPYRWARTVAPAEMPTGLVAMLKPRQPNAARFIAHRWTPNRLTRIERARKYVNAVPGAIQGQSGDTSTFRLACALVRGFDLTDSEALSLLSSWNYRCWPAWSEAELMKKIVSARRNGKEDIGSRPEYGR